MSMNLEKLAGAVKSLLEIDTKDDIFTYPDIVRQVCEKTCTVVLGVSPYEIRPDNEVQEQYYEKSIAELGFIKYTTRLCKDSGIDFEPARDLCGAPDKKRVISILSKLIAFLNFRNGKLKSYQDRYGKYMDQFSDATDKIDLLRAQIAVYENTFHEASENAASAEYNYAITKEEYDEVERQLNPLIEDHKVLDTQCDELEAKCKDLDKKIDEMGKKSVQLEAECESLDILLKEPPDKIREEVESIRKETAAKKDEMTALENKMATIEAQKVTLEKISDKIVKCMKIVDEIVALKKVNKEVKTTNKQLQEKIDALKAEKAALTKKTDTLKRKEIPNSKAKLEEIRQNRNKKRGEHLEEIKKLNKEKEESESRNSDVIAKTQELIQQTKEINGRTEARARAFSEEARKAEKILADLSANVNSYHRALFSYIPIKIEENDIYDDVTIGNNDYDDDDDDEDMDEDMADVNNEYGRFNFRRGNEGNIGTTSEDEKDDIYLEE